MQKNNLFKVAQPLMEIQHQEYLTFSKAAILMGCSRQYIYKLVAIGKLKASRISNRMAFIRRADIERMLEGNPYLEKSVQIDPCRRKKIDPLVKIRLTPEKSWRRGSI